MLVLLSLHMVSFVMELLTIGQFEIFTFEVGYPTNNVKGDQPSGGETTWTNTGATRYGRGQHKTGSFGDDMLRPSPNHGTQRLPNDE